MVFFLYVGAGLEPALIFSPVFSRLLDSSQKPEITEALSRVEKIPLMGVFVLLFVGCRERYVNHR